MKSIVILGSFLGIIWKQSFYEWMGFTSLINTAAAAAKSLQSCPTPSDPMDCSLPGSSVHGILQARVLEWGAIAFSVLLP